MVQSAVNDYKNIPLFYSLACFSEKEWLRSALCCDVLSKPGKQYQLNTSLRTLASF